MLHISLTILAIRHILMWNLKMVKPLHTKGAKIMKCEKCLHKSVCAVAVTPKTEIFNCNDYKDEELYIKLPCKYYDTVYLVLPGIAEVLVGTVKRISFGRTRGLVVCIGYKKISGWYTTGNFTQASFGKTVFIDKDKAEQKLQGDK